MGRWVKAVSGATSVTATRSPARSRSARSVSIAATPPPTMRTFDESVGWFMFPTVVDRRHAPSGAIAVRGGVDYGRRRRGPGGPRRILRGAGTGAMARHRRTGGAPAGGGGPLNGIKSEPGAPPPASRVLRGDGAAKPQRCTVRRMDVVIAGGGVAGLEALLGLRAMAGDRVRFTLAAPDPDFSYRPLAVAEPFAMGHAYRVPLSQFAEDAGAELLVDATVGVDDGAGRIRLRDGGERAYDAALIAPGGRPVAGLEGAVTWWPGGDPETYGGLLRDIDEGYAKRVVIAVP